MKLTQIVADTTLRFDAKAVALTWLRQKLSNRVVPLVSLCQVDELAHCSKPEEPFFYHEISSIDRFGMGEPYWIDESEIEQGSEEERILAKIEKGDIGRAETGTILVPKVRPYLGKFVLVKDRDVYYTRAFFSVRPKGISPELLYSILKHPLILEQMYRVCTIGKGYPTLSDFNLSRLVLVPITFLSPPDHLVSTVVPQIDEMFRLLSARRLEREIIDTVIGQIINVKNGEWPVTESFSRTHSELSLSVDLRLSAHFNRPVARKLIQELGRIETAKLIRLCSLPISLGISPKPYVGESQYYYLGPRAMTAERLDTDNLDMISEEFYQEKKGLYGVEFGDVFLRRSGASLGKVLYFDTTVPCIYSDFMMRLRFRDYMIAKYASYWMRSTIFQHLLQAVKVIGKGLQNIYPYQVAMMPIPHPNRYGFKEIVEEINKAIEENDRLRDEAQNKLNTVHELLSKTVELDVLAQELLPQL